MVFLGKSINPTDPLTWHVSNQPRKYTCSLVHVFFNQDSESKIEKNQFANTSGLALKNMVWSIKAALNFDVVRPNLKLELDKIIQKTMKQ